jgi:hypothetical protein
VDNATVPLPYWSRPQTQGKAAADRGRIAVPDSISGKFNVGGLLLNQPFRIRRLGHFGIDFTALVGNPDAAEWPETMAPLSDSYMGEPFLGPWG